MEPVVILVDTREQRPWQFNSQTEVTTLQTGDYSIKGFEERIAIERKSLDDLVATLSRGRERFEAEFERALELEQFFVIVEASITDIFSHKYTSQMSPTSVTGSVIAFQCRYGIPFLFYDTPTIAAQMAEKILLRYHTDHQCVTGEIGADIISFADIRALWADDDSWRDFFKKLDYKIQNSAKYRLIVWGEPDKQVREQVGQFCRSQGGEFKIASDEGNAYFQVEKFLRKYQQCHV